MRKLIVPTGKRFGKLIVVKEIEGVNNGRRFLLRCDCGNLTKARLGHLRNEHTRSCGCLAKEPKAKPMPIGKKFSRLTLLSEDKRSSQPDGRSVRVANVICDCGKKMSCLYANLTSGHTKSCGCYKSDKTREVKTKHGLSGTKLYMCWYDMISRCENKKDTTYMNYGYKGVTVSDEFKDVLDFAAWANESGFKEGLQLDRIDNRLGYSPSNCRFITALQNMRNTSRSYIWHVKGKSYSSASQAAKVHGVTTASIRTWCMHEYRYDDCTRERLYPDD